MKHVDPTSVTRKLYLSALDAVVHGGITQKGLAHMSTPTCFGSVGARVPVSVRNTMVKQ